MRPGAAKEHNITTSTTHCTYGPPTRPKLDLMGIRFLAPEDPNFGGGDPPADPPPANDPPKPSPPFIPTGVEQSPDEGKTFDAAHIEKLRQEAAANRVARKEDIQKQIDAALENGQKAWAKEFAKQIGAVDGEPEKTAEEIIPELQAERDEWKGKATTLSAKDLARNERDAINDASTAHGADNALMHAVVKSDELLKDIDPTVDDYPARMADIVKAAIEKNPKRHAVQVAPRRGGDAPPAGSSNPDGQQTIDEIRKDRQKRLGKI